MKPRGVHKASGQVRDLKGNILTPTLIHVLEKDAHGRATLCRIRYDDETIDLKEIQDTSPGKQIEFLVTYMTGQQLRGSIGTRTVAVDAGDDGKAKTVAELRKL